MTFEIADKDKVSEEEDIYCPVCEQWLARLYPDFSGDISVQCSHCSEWVKIQVK